jgi:hypothetical protein
MIGGVHRVVVVNESNDQEVVGIFSQFRLVKFLWENVRFMRSNNQLAQSLRVELFNDWEAADIFPEELDQSWLLDLMKSSQSSKSFDEFLKSNLTAAILSFAVVIDH